MSSMVVPSLLFRKASVQLVLTFSSVSARLSPNELLPAISKFKANATAAAGRERVRTAGDVDDMSIEQIDSLHQLPAAPEDSP